MIIKVEWRVLMIARQGRFHTENIEAVNQENGLSPVLLGPVPHRRGRSCFREQLPVRTRLTAGRPVWSICQTLCVPLDSQLEVRSYAFNAIDSIRHLTPAQPVDRCFICYISFRVPLSGKYLFFWFITWPVIALNTGGCNFIGNCRRKWSSETMENLAQPSSNWVYLGHFCADNRSSPGGTRTAFHLPSDEANGRQFWKNAIFVLAVGDDTANVRIDYLCNIRCLRVKVTHR